jgi:hypothetical protein
MARKQQYFTPIAVFKYCHLNKPDTRYKAEGEYSVNVLLDKDDPAVQNFLEKIEAQVADQQRDAEEAFSSASPKQKAKWKKDGITAPIIVDFYEDELTEEGEPTGNIIMKFKTKASFTDRKTGETVKKVVKLSDPKGQVIPHKKRPLVYAGTTGRVAFVIGYSFIAENAKSFMSFYLNEAQIVDLVSGGGGSSAFGAVEGGGNFDVDDLDEYDADEDADDSDADDDGDDLDDDEIPF